MRCTTAREQLERLAVGDGAPRIRALAAFAHMARCSECQREWRRLQRLRQAAHSLPAPSLPAELRAHVLAEIAAAPVPTPADASPEGVLKGRGNRMVQRSLIAGVGLIGFAGALLLLTPHSRRTGAPLAMGDVQKALEHVNTWHLTGWKRVADKEIPWEVWGRRTPFFYHERIGGQETLDDGRERTIVFPPSADYGNKQTVILKIPSRPDAESSMGLSFVMGLDRNQGNSNKPWRQDADTETFIREETTIFGNPAVPTEQVNGVFTFEKGSRLPIRYERLLRLYRNTQNAQGAYDLHNLSDKPSEKEWTGAHLDAQYDVDLDAAAFHISAPADTRVINAVQDAASPTMPRYNAASKNGLTLHLTQGQVDPHGNVLLQFEGFIGNVNFKGAKLPFSWDTMARNAGNIPTPWADRGSGDRGYPQAVTAHDERGRLYTEVTGLEFLRYTGERAWLALAPLVPFNPGESLPRQMTFLIRTTLNTYQPLPEMKSNMNIELINEVIPCKVELPPSAAEVNLKALSRQYGTPENIEGRGFATTFEAAAAEARVEAWHSIAFEAWNRSKTYRFVPGNRHPVATNDPDKRREAEKTAQQAVHYMEEAVKEASPHSRQRIQSNLDSLKQFFKKEGLPIEAKPGTPE